MTLYQVLHERQIVLAVILGALPPVLPARQARPARRRPRRDLTKYY
jgi:hypothetical protein